MRIAPFRIEQYYALHEFTASYMLSSSDAETVTLADLLALEPDAEARLLGLRLGYTEPPGAPELRGAIAAIYESLGAEDVIVVAAAEEGIFTAYHALLEPGDHVVVETPCYESALELARSAGAEVTEWRRSFADGWVHDLDALERALRPDTRLVYVNTPHNPTGTSMPRHVLDRVVELCAERGAWLFCDEVYRELEHEPGDRLPAASDLYERALSLGSMSKATVCRGCGSAGSPLATGLRSRASSMSSTTPRSARVRPASSSARWRSGTTRPWPSATAGIVPHNLPLLDDFFDRRADSFSWVRPTASPIGFPRLLGGDDDRPLLRQLSAGAGGQQQRHAERGRRNRRPIQDLCRRTSRTISKSAPRLTLNLGLRWNVWGTFKEVYNRMSFFNPDLPNPLAGNHLGALQFAGDGPEQLPLPTPDQDALHQSRAAPGSGLPAGREDRRARRLLARLRARRRSRRTRQRTAGTQPARFQYQRFVRQRGHRAAGVQLGNGYPRFQPAPFINPSYGIGFITAAAGAPIAGPGTAQTITFGDPELGGKPPYYENWNLNIQHSFTPSLTLSVAYSGSSGHFLPGAGNAGPMTNQIPLQYIALGSLLGQTLTPATLAQAQAVFPNIAHALPQFHRDHRPGAEAVPAVQRHRQSVGEPGNLDLQRPAVHAHAAILAGPHFYAGLHLQQAAGQPGGSPRNPSTIRSKRARRDRPSARGHRHFRLSTAIRRRPQTE